VGHNISYHGSWKINTNDEVDNLIKGRNIVNFIKAQRISWLGHISRLEAGRTFKRILVYDWQPHAIRKRGRPNIRWNNDVREDLKDLGIFKWTTRTQGRSSWMEIVEQATAFKKWNCRALWRGRKCDAQL
jgi:hypothetical protein